MVTLSVAEEEGSFWLVIKLIQDLREGHSRLLPPHTLPITPRAALHSKPGVSNPTVYGLSAAHGHAGQAWLPRGTGRWASHESMTTPADKHKNPPAPIL